MGQDKTALTYMTFQTQTDNEVKLLSTRNTIILTVAIVINYYYLQLKWLQNNLNFY